MVNPIAGWGRGLQAGRQLESVLQELDLPYAIRHTGPSPQDSAPALVRQLLAEGYDCLASVGGDGTFSQVAAAVVESGLDVPVVLVPGGTGNVMARALGVRSGRTWLRRLFGSPTGTVLDAAIIGDRMSFAVAGVGFDAKVVRALRRSAMLPRLAGWAATGLSQLNQLRPFRLRLRPLPDPASPASGLPPDAPSFEDLALCLAICNTAHYGGGLHMAPGADPSDGRLDYCLIGDVPLPELPALGVALLLGCQALHPAVRMWRTSASFMAETDPPEPWHYDGEPGGLTPAQVSIRPACLRVLLAPPPAPRSPAKPPAG